MSEINSYIKADKSVVSFATKDEMFDYLRKNKELLKIEKKATFKEADGIGCYFVVKSEDKVNVFKDISEVVENIEAGKLKVSVVINATNIVDSHLDLHLPNMWNKSLKENSMIYFLQEHKREFKKIISYPEDVKAYVVNSTFKDIGYKLDATTQLLVFDATIENEDNEYMLGRYKRNKVKNHSVGMQYVKIEFCMNSDSKWDVEEKANWDKYYSKVANKEFVDAYGYFWAVTEAKVIEGSAVPLGSNPATPTISMEEVKEEPTIVTPITITEPQKCTLTTEELKRVFEKSLNVKN